MSPFTLGVEVGKPIFLPKQVLLRVDLRKKNSRFMTAFKIQLQRTAFDVNIFSAIKICFSVVFRIPRTRSSGCCTGIRGSRADHFSTHTNDETVCSFKATKHNDWVELTFILNLHVNIHRGEHCNQKCRESITFHLRSLNSIKLIYPGCRGRL